MHIINTVSLARYFPVPMLISVIFQVETYGGESIQIMKLRNPISTMDEYIGPWSQNSLKWSEIPSKEKDRLGIKHMTNGEFW